MAEGTPRDVKTILVATGLTIESVGGVHAARVLAKALGASLHAVFAYGPVSEQAEKAVPGLSAAHDRQVSDELQKFAAAHGLEGAPLHAVRGSPSREVVRLAKEVGADLIVVGRYGKGGLKVGALGTAADRIVRESPVSVLVVPPEFRGEYTRIGAATDFSEGSDLALRRAWGLCRSPGAAELAVLHAFEVPPGHHMISSYEDAVKRLTGVFGQLATEQVERVLGKGARTRVLCREGDTAKGVAAMASEARLDLLVIGAYSRSMAASALLGYTSERIIRNAPCSVWAEKSPALVQGVIGALREWVR
jgi:nucleotide-binding universal stress UspA family protein